MVSGGKWLVTRVGVGPVGSGGTGAGDGDAGIDSSAINAGTASVAGSAGRAGGDGVVSDARAERVDEPVAGYPKWPGPTATAPLRKLGRRTLTNLYNERPQWLEDAHGESDTAVAAAYGMEADISDDEALEVLLSANQAQ